jgi:hypothetical protein
MDNRENEKKTYSYYFYLEQRLIIFYCIDTSVLFQYLINVLTNQMILFNCLSIF